MFTGLIEEIGIIKSIAGVGGGKRIVVECKEILSDTKVDDSISINGICQTVVKMNANSFEFDSVEETIKKTTIPFWKENQKVNLERALKLSDRFGGHLVMGHVDTVGEIVRINKLQSSAIYEVDFPASFSKYIIQHGSITINGTSLTIANHTSTTLEVSIIPHTLTKTLIKDLRIGDKVNLEFDMIGKYVEKLLGGNNISGLTFNKLEELGY
jgi:riboflavin synthase